MVPLVLTLSDDSTANTDQQWIQPCFQSDQEPMVSRFGVGAPPISEPILVVGLGGSLGAKRFGC